MLTLICSKKFVMLVWMLVCFAVSVLEDGRMFGLSTLFLLATPFVTLLVALKWRIGPIEAWLFGIGCTCCFIPLSLLTYHYLSQFSLMPQISTLFIYWVSVLVFIGFFCRFSCFLAETIKEQ